MRARRQLRLRARIIEAVVATEDDLTAGVRRAGGDGHRHALEVEVAVVIELVAVRGHEGRGRSGAGVVPAIAELGSPRVDVCEGERRAAGVTGHIGAVVGAEVGAVRLGEVVRESDHAFRGVEAIDEVVVVVVELQGLDGAARHEGTGAAVRVPAIADLDGERVHRGGVRRVVIRAEGRVARELIGDLGGVLEAVVHQGRVRGLARVTDGEAVAVVIELIDGARRAVAEQAVAVVVQLVADLRGARAVGGVFPDGVVQIVAVAFELGDAVSVVVLFLRNSREGIAVVVEPVGDLHLSGIDQRVAIIAVGAPRDARGRRHAGGDGADDVAVAVDVEL